MKSVQFMNAAQLLKDWQGHRNLTRKVIEAFPEKELFEFSIGGMRTFSQLVLEFLAIAGPGIISIVNNEQISFDANAVKPTSKLELLTKWDEATVIIDEYFPKISEDRFQEKFNLFGQFESPIFQNILYFIDNEIHHRGQAYVYLRALGIEPPFFWER